MSRLLVIFAVSVLLLCNGCGGTWAIAGKWGASATQQVVGVISAVYLQYLTDSEGTTQTMTVVTFISAGVANPITFCGDQSAKFPENESVTVTYDPGTACSSLISVRRM